MAKIKSGPFAGLKRAHYRVIVTDFPWHYVTYSAKGQGKSASRHYKTMSLKEIATLPIAELAHKDGAVLLCWCPGNQVENAMRIMRDLAFPFVAFAGWLKLTKTGSGVNIGTGYHFRDSFEPVLIGRRGPRVPFRSPKPAISNVTIARLREHSRKPEQFFRSVERLYRGPYVSLYERTDRKNWTAWGDEAGKWRT